MCIITSTLVSLSLAAASTAATMAAQQQAAKGQANYQNKLYSNTASLATQNYLRTANMVSVRRQQEQAAAGITGQQNTDAAQQARSHALTSAAEAGVQGTSVQELLNDYSRIEAGNNANLHQNLQWENEQGQEDLASARAQAMGQTSSATPRPVQGPSLVNLGLQFASEGVKACRPTLSELHPARATSPSWWNGPVFGSKG
jgi:hypothetical protein